LKIIKNLTPLIYGLIITLALLSIAGCGFKADPYYENVAQKSNNAI
jgi:predicted small lipoprotein YifL